LVQSSPLDVDALLVRVREIRRTSRWPRPARAIRHRWSTGPGCISIDGGLTCRFRWLSSTAKAPTVSHRRRRAPS